MPSGNFQEDEGAAGACVEDVLSVVSLIMDEDISIQTNDNHLVPFGIFLFISLRIDRSDPAMVGRSERIHNPQAGASN